MCGDDVKKLKSFLDPPAVHIDAVNIGQKRGQQKNRYHCHKSLSI